MNAAKSQGVRSTHEESIVFLRQEGDFLLLSYSERSSAGACSVSQECPPYGTTNAHGADLDSNLPRSCCKASQQQGTVPITAQVQ